MRFKKPTISDVKRILKKSNGGIVPKVTWNHPPTLCKDFDNKDYYSAVAKVEAEGYRTKLMGVTRYPASHEYAGTWVR